MLKAKVFDKNVNVENYDGKTIYRVRIINKYNKPVYNAVKRIFDVVCSFAALLVLGIPMIIIGILIKIDSEGEAVFKQERLGKDGKMFVLYKFRSMVVDAEKNGAQWANAEDVRCTKIGKILRKTRADELMQLFNILKGDMSFVGPRPERPIFYDKFEEYISGFSQRLCVVPGLTGLAQINGGYDLSPEQKVALDIEYIEKRSFLLDLKLIIKTVVIVFNHKGAR